MDLLNSIRNFDNNRLKSTVVGFRRPDGSLIQTNKFGVVVESSNTGVNFTEPNFSQYGYIPNSNPDLQIGTIKIDSGRSKLLIGMFLTHSLISLTGSYDVAGNLDLLKENGVTHIINLIWPYATSTFESHFAYLNLTAYDNLTFNLDETIRQSLDFITQRVLTHPSGGGVCLIHCDAGRCRSAAIAIAYLIQHEGFSFQDAYIRVNNERNIAVNLNFKTQLRLMEEQFR